MMRHTGVGLHKTNFVACFLDEQDKPTVKTFPLTEQGLLTFQRALTQADEVAVEMSAKIVRSGKDLPGLRRLLQVRGLGVLTAIGLLAEIGDINWFGGSEQLVAYAGLATSVRQSNETDRRGRITRSGLINGRATLPAWHDEKN